MNPQQQQFYSVDFNSIVQQLANEASIRQLLQNDHSSVFNTSKIFFVFNANSTCFCAIKFHLKRYILCCLLYLRIRRQFNCTPAAKASNSSAISSN